MNWSFSFFVFVLTPDSKVVKLESKNHIKHEFCRLLRHFCWSNPWKTIDRQTSTLLSTFKISLLFIWHNIYSRIPHLISKQKSSYRVDIDFWIKLCIDFGVEFYSKVDISTATRFLYRSRVPVVFDQKIMTDWAAYMMCLPPSRNELEGKIFKFDTQFQYKFKFHVVIEFWIKLYIYFWIEFYLEVDA